MLPYQMLLPFLLYMSPEIGLKPTQLTSNCFVFDNKNPVLYFNRVHHVALPSDQEIEQVMDYFKDASFRWTVDVVDQETASRLDHYGLHNFGIFPAMSLDLSTLDVTSYNDGISIVAIDINDSAALQQWAHIASRVYVHVSQGEFIDFLQVMQQRVTNGAVKLYVGFYQDQAVAASMTIVHGDVVSVHLTSTLSGLRKKGLGFAMVHTQLMDAKNLGCHQAILLSSTLGKSVYQRLGFKDYAQYYFYGLNKPVAKI